MFPQTEYALGSDLTLDSQWRTLHLTKSFQGRSQTVDGRRPTLREANSTLLSAAALTLFLYDYALNFDREVVLVWRQSFGRRTFLFLMNRYLGGVTLMASFCVFFAMPQKPSVSRSFVPFQAWMTACLVWTTQGLLQFRCHVFNHFHKGVMTALSLIFGLEVCAMVAMLGITSKTDGDHIVEGPMCTVADAGIYLYTFTIPILSFECLMLALTFSGARRHMKEMRTVMSDWTPDVRLVTALRDIFFSFAGTCIGYSVAGAIWLHIPSSFEIPFTVILVVNLILTSRMFLNLRELTHRYNPEDLPGWMTWREDIEMEDLPSFSAYLPHEYVS